MDEFSKALLGKTGEGEVNLLTEEKWGRQNELVDGKSWIGKMNLTGKNWGR